MKAVQTRPVAKPHFGLILVLGLALSCKSPVLEPENVVEDLEQLQCSKEAVAALGPLDVAIAIDTSLSTQRPTGHDVDGDGEVGAFAGNYLTDRDDTFLAAQLAAVKPLLEMAKGADIRFSIVTFSGPSSAAPLRKRTSVVRKIDARIVSELTEDFSVLDAVLEQVADHGGRGTTNFFAGMQRANLSLMEGADAERPSRRVVLFISDSSGPTQRDVDGSVTYLDPHMMRAARFATRHSIVFHTFGLSGDSGEWRYSPIGQIAGATGGNYHVVDDPQALYCHLASSLVTSQRPL